MENNRGRLDYKWVVVGLCFMMVFVALGFCSSPKSLYISPISEALGIDRSVYSITDSCRYISSAVVNIFFGFLVARFGPKKLILAGLLSLIASSLTYAYASNVFMIYLAGVLLGIGLSWTTTTMVGYVVTRWCKENKGTIMGAILASNGIGGAVAIQIVSPMIASAAEGYRKAYIFVSCVLAAVALLMLIFFRDSRRGVPLGDAAPVKKKKKHGTDWVGIEFADAVRKKYFWGLLVCIFFSGFVLQGMWGVSAAHLKDVGIDPAMVSKILSAHSLVLALAKFMTGFIYDRTGLRFTSTMCMVFAIGSAATILFVAPNATGIFLAFVYSVIASFALPLETIVLPIYASDILGAKSFDKALGIFVSVNTAGYALGAPLFNLVYDKLGSYNAGFMAAGIIMVCIVILFQFVLSGAEGVRRKVMQNEAATEEPEAAEVTK